MDTYANGFPRNNVFQSDEQMARFSFRLPQGDLREMISIDPSKPRLAAVISQPFFDKGLPCFVNEYRRLHEAGVAQVIWEEDLPEGEISTDDLPHPWDWEVKQRLLEQENLIKPYDLMSRDLEFIAREMSRFKDRTSRKLVSSSWMIGEDGEEITYFPKVHGGELVSVFLQRNMSDISRLVSGLSYTPSEDVGLSDSHRRAIEMVGSPFYGNKTALEVVLCDAPGVSVSFPDLARNLASYIGLVEEYNEDWAMAAFGWIA